MFSQTIKTEYKKSMFYFCISFCLVLMSAWFPIAGGLDVFMQFWRVEVAASIFLAGTLVYLLHQHSKVNLTNIISRSEFKFVVLPLMLFIVWSGFSMIWSPSWKTALYHTLIWTEYLIFYLIIRQVLELPKSYNLFITLLSVVILIITTPAIIEYCSIVYLGGNTGFSIRYQKYGEPFLTLFPLITFGILRLNGRRLALGIFVVTVIWLFIISTVGRTNMILFVFGMAVITGSVFIVKRYHRYRRKMALVILALVIMPIPLHLGTFLTDKPSVPIITRVNDELHISSSNNFRKLMVSVSSEMIYTSPLIGIGAGNFGMQFNNYRAIYAEKNPMDVNLSNAESELAERAHNEYLQIFAELGIVGTAIFVWFLAGIGIMFLNFISNFQLRSFVSPAALLGLALFLVSSAVTSYSFRFMQNGLIFFFVLAVSAKSLLSIKNEKKAPQPISLANHQLKFGYCFGIFACLFLFGFCSIRVASTVYTVRANQTADIEQAKLLYQTAVALDKENPNADYFYGVRLIKENKPSEAVPYFKRATTLGLGTSKVYSYLATAHSLSGDNVGAVNSFTEAVRLYPLSPFVRVRYASLLQANGSLEEAAQQLEYARQINKKSANTWWSLMNQGLPETTRTAYKEKDYVQVMDLTPPQSIEAVLTERNIKFPGEKVEFNFPD